MPTYIVTGPEDGLESPIGIYDPSPFLMLLGGVPSFAAMRFTGLPFTETTDTGIPNAPPLVGRTHAATVISALDVLIRGTVVVPGTIVLNFVDELAPTTFSAINLPSTKTMIPIASLTMVLAGPPLIPFTIGPEALGHITRRQRSLGWQGALAFTLSCPDGGGIILNQGGTPNAFRLTTTELPFVTGISGPWDAHSRIDRCPRCGRLQPRERFVVDGYKPNLLVCSRCWDEPDLVGKTVKPGREKPGINQ